MARVWSTPTEAEELWSTAVITIPKSIPNSGRRGESETATIKFMKPALSLSGAMESDIRSMPRKSRPKPVKMEPRFLTSVFFDASIRITPTSTDAAATLEKFSAISSEVTVVPMLAPIITPTACASVIMPALTKPTTMTVVAVDDWIIAVTTKPTSTAKKRFPVSTSSIRLSLAPAAFSSPSPIVLIPKRNRPSPPAIDRILVILIF